MSKLIQFQTAASRYDGAFGGYVGWPAAGMGYIITTDSGSLIVVDGGNAEDAAELVETLCRVSVGTPTVEHWIITHPHGDHYFALREICRTPELISKIKVKEFIYHFPENFLTNEGTHICAGALADMEDISRAFGADIRKPKLNEQIFCDGIELRFIYTPDDCSIFKGQSNANVCSLIFTVSGQHKKVMFTGDAFRRSLLLTAWRFGNELKCDILQLPHHGLCDTGVMDFYKYANAPTVLVPISKAGHRSMHSGEHSEKDTEANLWAEANAEAVYNAFDGTVELDI